MATFTTSNPIKVINANIEIAGITATVIPKPNRLDFIDAFIYALYFIETGNTKMFPVVILNYLYAFIIVIFSNKKDIAYEKLKITNTPTAPASSVDRNAFEIDSTV